jgi:hypothetical protein
MNRQFDFMDVLLAEHSANMTKIRENWAKYISLEDYISVGP